VLGMVLAELGRLDEAHAVDEETDAGASFTLAEAYVAAGRIDVMQGRGLHPWDSAAGILLVREAGGVSISAEGDKAPFETGTILAGNSDLVALIRAEIAAAGKNT